MCNSSLVQERVKLMTHWKRVLSVIYRTAFLEFCKSNCYWVLPDHNEGSGICGLAMWGYYFPLSAFQHLPVPLSSVHQRYTVPTPTGFMPYAYQHDRCQYYCSREFKAHCWIWKVITFSRGAGCSKSNIKSMWVKEETDREETALWNQTSSGLAPGLSSPLCAFYSLLYLFLPPSRLPKGSGHFGGASVGGGSHLVPRLGGSAYLETAGHHPRQTGVRQIWGGAGSCQVGHGQWI